MNDTTKTAAQIARPAPVPVIDTGAFAELLDSARFAQIQRVANLFSESDLVPEIFQGKPANCAVALQMAFRLQVDPMMLMQNMYIVHGRPGIEAKLAIALMNQRGPFTGPLQWKFDGEGDKRSCTCYATHRQTGEQCRQTVTMAMVKAEGWDSKSGSKWKTMPDIMFQYRSAMFLGRLYCPEVLLGLPTDDELRDVGERTVQGQAEILMPRAKAAPSAGTTTITINKETGEIGQWVDATGRPALPPDPKEPALSDAERAEKLARVADFFGQATEAAKPAETATKAQESPAPDLSKRASEAQRNMVISIAKRQGFNVAQLDEQLVERFSWGIDEMPMAMVSEVTQFVKEMKA